MSDLSFEFGYGAKIKVIGVGGGGGNALNTMISAGLEGVEFIAANTDCQALEMNLAGVKTQLGSVLTSGLGAGADPQVGRNAALESEERLREILSGADMVFVTAGMGGGTGTGAAPVIAKIARELGALTVGVVTKPFAFEGRRRMRQAEGGLKALGAEVDALVCVPNNRLIELAGDDMSLEASFELADAVVLQAVKGISDLITVEGHINVDFADVCTIMRGQGLALMGTGQASGRDRALRAVHEAINSPLLDDVSIEGATKILINITGGSPSLAEVSMASSHVESLAHEDANIIFGSVTDESMGDQIKVTVIATGFDRRSSLPEGGRQQMSFEGAPGAPRSTRRRAEHAEAAPPPLPREIRDLRQARHVTMDEAARQYGMRPEHTPAPRAPVVLPKNAPDPLEEDEYDVPAFQRRQETLR